MRPDVLALLVNLLSASAAFGQMSLPSNLSDALLADLSHDTACKFSLGGGSLLYISRVSTMTTPPSLTLATPAWSAPSSLPVRPIELEGDAAAYASRISARVASFGMGKDVTHLTTGTPRSNRLVATLAKVSWDSGVSAPRLWCDSDAADSPIVLIVERGVVPSQTKPSTIVVSMSTEPIVKIDVEMLPGATWGMPFSDVIDVAQTMNALDLRGFAGPRADVIEAATSGTAGGPAPLKDICVSFKGAFTPLRDAAFESVDQLGSCTGIVRAARRARYSDPQRDDIVDPLDPDRNRDANLARWIAGCEDPGPFIDPIIFLMLE